MPELLPLTEADARGFWELHASIGGVTGSPETAAQAIRGFMTEKVVGRKLVIDGVFVAGGQLTLQKYPHSYEMGYWVHKAHQRRGYGLQVARGLLELGFGELKCHRIFAKTFSNNAGSLRILEKTGMRREGVHRDVGFKDGVYYDEHWFGMLAAEWPASH